MSVIILEKKLVSIITPAYNSEAFIKETIESVLAQTYTNWEMIIVDDQSTDRTAEMVMSMMVLDKRIRLYQNALHLGAAVTRNVALKIAKGRWVAFLDSDDMWEPTKLEKQLQFMEANHYYFSCHKYKEIDENSKEIGVMVGCKKHISKKDFYACCWPGCLTVMYDAAYVGLIQIADVKMNNDTAMWLKVAGKADCYYLDEPLAKYRRRQGSITQSGIIARICGHYHLFRDTQDRDALSAMVLTGINIICNAYKKLFYVKKYELMKE